MFEDSTYEELSGMAIRKFGITETPHNQALMKGIISERVEEFVKELSRAVKMTEKQSTCYIM